MRHDGHGHLGLFVGISAVMELIFEVSHVWICLKRDRVALGMICEREEARNKWEGNMRSQYLELCNEVLIATNLSNERTRRLVMSQLENRSN